MPRIRRVDTNQPEIVAWLRRAGASVAITSSLGQGFPDIVIGWRGFTLLAEIKSGDEPLTPDEAAWHAAWLGQVAVLRSPSDAQRLLREWS